MKIKLAILFTLVSVFCHADVLTNITIGQKISIGTNISNIPDSGGGGGAAWVLISSTTKVATGSSPITTSAIDTTTANLLVVFCSFGNSATVTDNKGNTWTSRGNTPGTPVFSFADVTSSPVVGSGHTFTVSGGFGQSVIVQAWKKASGAATIDGTEVVNSTGSWGSGTTLKPGSITPATSADLMITGLAYNVSSSLNATVDSGYTDTSVAQGLGIYVYHMAYKIKSNGVAEDPAWLNSTGSGGINASTAHVAYK
jgi:hypothetical protein